MKLTVLVIAGFLAASTNAAGGFTFDKSQPNYDNQYLPDDTSGVGYKSEDFDEPEVPSERYEGYEKGIQQNESEPVQLEDKEGQKSVAVSDATITNVKTKTEESGQIVSEEAQKETETQISTTKELTVTTAAPDTSETNSSETKSSPAKVPKPKSAMELLTLPIVKFALKSLGKDALRSLDIGAVCDTVQLMDWKSYHDLLEQDDYEGIKEKLSKDDVLNAVSETFQEYLAKYTKMVTDAYHQGIFEKSLRNFLELLSFDRVIQMNGTMDLQKNVQNFIQSVVIDKKQREGLQSMQNSMKTLLEALQGSGGKNSIDFSKKSGLQGSKGQTY